MSPFFRVRKRQLPSHAARPRSPPGFTRAVGEVGESTDSLSPRLTDIKLGDVLVLFRSPGALATHHHLSGFYNFLFLGFLRFLFCIKNLQYCHWKRFRYPFTNHTNHQPVPGRGKGEIETKSQNVWPRKKTECLAGLSQVCEADTTDGICQRLGCFEASAISGIDSPSWIGRDIQQHTCGPQWQVGLIHLGCFPLMQC